MSECSVESDMVGFLVSLRRMVIEDALTIYKWRTSKDVAINFPSGGDISINDHTDWMDHTLNNENSYYWIVTGDNGVSVGVIWLENVSVVHRHAEFGFYLGDMKQRNTGLMAEAEYLLLDAAFNRLQLKKVYCESLEYNRRVLSQHKRFGFKEDGRLRSHVFKNDCFHDVVVMSILDTEFEEKHKYLRSIFQSLGAR